MGDSSDIAPVRHATRDACAVLARLRIFERTTSSNPKRGAYPQRSVLVRRRPGRTTLARASTPKRFIALRWPPGTSCPLTTPVFGVTGAGGTGRCKC
jgi:hypothetical protein